MSKRKKSADGARRPRVVPSGAWPVRYHPQARAEADTIPAQERKAVDNAVVAPEAQKDKAGFERAVSAAKTRLVEVES